MIREELYQVPLPERTESYTPVSHKQLIEETKESLDRQGFAIAEETYSANKYGTQLVGKFGLVNNEDPEIGFQIAIRNSYDKSMSVAFAAGNIAWICSNGLIAGDMVYMRKHTGSVNQELRENINITIGQMSSHYDSILLTKEQMRNIEINRSIAAELCGRMYVEHDLIKATQLSIIRDELRKPSFDYGDDHGSLWQFYNHITHSLKKSHPLTYIQDHKNIHDFIVDEYELN